MIVVVIHWKIRPDMVGEFLEFWKTAAVVNDRRGLVGEFHARVGRYFAHRSDPKSSKRNHVCALH